nr:ATP-dependent zinc metalloprotease FtsH [Oleiagrimonas sp. C23AA]
MWYALVVLLMWVALQGLLTGGGEVKSIPFSQFRQQLKDGEIASVEIGSERIDGTYRKTDTNGRPLRFRTVPVDPDMARLLSSAKVTYSAQPDQGQLGRTLGWLLPMAIFFGVWFWMARRLTGAGSGGGLMAVGKSKAKVFMEKRIGTTFADVAGVDEAKEELKEIIAFLRDPGSYGRLGAHVPKGVLLVGPPGTGKTLLARAVAGEAGVPFFSISGSEFVEMFVGVGAARVRDLFEQARQQAPCIIFIDELDALGRARGAFLPGGGHDEKEQTLNQLLTELDGFDPSSGVVLLGATNRPEILDPALLRAGRFDRQILVDRPDKAGREAILRVHLKKIHLADGVKIDELAALTTGLTGADLANLANEAALLATRRGAEAVTMDDLQSALERIVAGLEKKSRVLSPHERQVVAHHEIGHALVAMALPGADPVQKISIIPRGISALGYTIQRPTEDRFLMARGELVDRMTVLLGGRAAETLCFDEVSTGAADDLAKATEIARSMVTRFGMSEDLGQVSYETDPAPMLGPATPVDWRPRSYAESTAASIDRSVRDLIDQAFRRARQILTEQRPLLERATAQLLQHETLSGDDIQALRREALPVPQRGGAVTSTTPAARL